jgi:hypothetical protein
MHNYAQRLGRDTQGGGATREGVAAMFHSLVGDPLGCIGMQS